MKTKYLLIFAALALVGLSAAAVAYKAAPQNEPRKIKALHQPQRNDIGDLVTYNVMPSRTVSIDQLDPFLFLNHHGPQTYPPNNSGLPFGPHPHKGFETVTFILEGDILHKDNSGHTSVIGEGGIQWMTAGKGIVHSEISSDEFKRTGGPVEILQLWVNLPAKHKGVDPGYQGFQKEDIPALKLDDGQVTLNLISGNWEGKQAPVESITGVFMSTIEMQEGGKLDLEVDHSREVFFYIVSGKAGVNDKTVDEKTLVEFAKSGSSIAVEALEETVILFGHAAPTNEPVVARGPFVMNTEEEIRQAYRDYQGGKFGRGVE